MTRLVKNDSFSDKENEDFQKAVQPVFDWLYNIGNPYLEVKISLEKASVIQDSIVVFEDEKELE